MLAIAGLLAFGVTACKDDGTPDGLDLDNPRLDPKYCESCHPTHYREWLGSMHAYAAEDPVFLAMNARGQRETNGALGDFCVNCHAPLAVRMGLTTDGLNLPELPQQVRGVTCYFCHTVESVDGTHNNPLTLAGNSVMLGAIRDPVDNEGHSSAYSVLLDSATMESGDMCGTCHDIVTDAGVHLETTYAEWQTTFFADTAPLSGGPAIYGLRCGNCHMGPGETGTIADAPGVKADRVRHPHAMPAVDVALHDWPDATLGPQLRAEQEEAIAFLRKSALCSTVCVNPDGAGGSNVDVYLHNEFAAHAWTSGASQDRRAWLEVEAFEGGTSRFAIGPVPEGQPVAEFDAPDMWRIRDYLYDEAGNEVHMFWEARSKDGETLPPSEMLSPMGDASTWRVRRFNVPDATVDRVTSRLRLRPVGLDVLDSLIESGDLDPAVRDAMPVFDVEPAVLEWTPETAETFDDYGPCVSSSSVCGAPIIGAPLP